MSFSQTTTATSTSTTASSPSPNSTPPNFTDWLHISPAPTMPFQDLSSSALHYLYNISDFLTFNKTPPPASVVPMSLSPPAIFNSHHRMLSLDSTTATLTNTPSPGSLALFAPSVAEKGHRSQTPPLFSTSSTPLFASSTSDFIEDLQTSPFGNYLRDSMVPFASLPLEDISPVVRADRRQESLVGPNKPSGSKKSRNRKNHKQTSSFVQKLCSVPSPRKTLVPSSLDLLEESIVSQYLLSPCKLVPSTSDGLRNLSVDTRPALDIPTSPLSDVSGFLAVAPLSLAQNSPDCDISSPLTPLTNSPSPAHPPLKIVIKLKRKSEDELPMTPPRRSKRRTALVETRSSPDTKQGRSSSVPESSPELNPTDPHHHRRRPVYTNRKLPPTIEISASYPLFYRRFPASRYYELEDSDSPEDLFGAVHPGGSYNPPRGPLDLYTPRFVKGKGTEKVGLCPICIEPYERGGESKKLWLAMKFSAFKCVFLFYLLYQIFHALSISYHMQYSHGISASTGRPFSPPIAFCVIPRLNPGKKEKHFIQQGKCHKCTQWIAVEGIKDMESKVKELHWWKHAAACHHDSTLPGEGEYYETDDVLMKLISLNLAHATT